MSGKVVWQMLKRWFDAHFTRFKAVQMMAPNSTRTPIVDYFPNRTKQSWLIVGRSAALEWASTTTAFLRRNTTHSAERQPKCMHCTHIYDEFVSISLHMHEAWPWLCSFISVYRLFAPFFLSSSPFCVCVLCGFIDVVGPSHFYTRNRWKNAGFKTTDLAGCVYIYT